MWFVNMVCLLMVLSGTTIGVIYFATIEVTLGITVALSVMVLLKLTNASPNEVQSI